MLKYCAMFSGSDGKSLLLNVCLTSLFVLSASSLPAMAEKPHVIEVHQRLLSLDDGLVLGNGDLSVSVYQTVDRIIWRLGKGDVWDRRHDTSDDPRPVSIDEFSRGIREEGWKAPHNQLIVATKGTDQPERVKEISLGPPSYQRRPYPCPKPLGELCLHLPPKMDLAGMSITQRLVIEEGRLDIECSWPDGRKLTVESFITPRDNALVVHWQAQDCPGLKFSVYRWPDPTIDEYAARLVANTGNEIYRVFYNDPKVTPLRPPTVGSNRYDGAEVKYIEQTFYPDPLFPEGFRFRLAPFMSAGKVQAVDLSPLKEARLSMIPSEEMDEGWLALGVSTSSDEGGVNQSIQHFHEALTPDPAGVLQAWRKKTIEAAEAFWAKSSVTIDDSLMENLWYQNLHVRRCIYRSDTIPPGLFMPSTLGDYSVWHGDYHWNYNFESPFWGSYESNHMEIGDAYFRAVDFALPIGRKIARDYYNARGAFFQIVSYPIEAKDDVFGTGPLCRMAYMTGWVMQPHWLRYQFTKDKNWLHDRGYPVIRDCALFLTDFLKKGEDGLYHAFPSPEQESPFSDDPMNYTDKPQVMQHIRYCLRAAIRASEELELDQELRAQWQDRLDHLAPDNGDHMGAKYDPELQGLEKWCAENSPPQYGYGKPYQLQQRDEVSGASPLTGKFGALWLSYPLGGLGALRNGTFHANRDYPAMRQYVEETRHPNGLLFERSVMGYQNWVLNENLSILAALQEMMLQSWDGILRVFPAWPSQVNASFTDLRAQGAFLVSAAWSDGRVTSLRVRSEVGGTCRLYLPWSGGLQVMEEAGPMVPVKSEPEGVVNFAAEAGQSYTISRSE